MQSLEQAYQQSNAGSIPGETITVTSLGAIRQTVHEAVAAERESCALIADALAAQWDDEGAIQGACIVADAIRARRKR
jgi:hypothetical protein